MSSPIHEQENRRLYLSGLSMAEDFRTENGRTELHEPRGA